jgi:hypothetical protein
MDLIERAKYAIEWGNSDQLHRDLLAAVEALKTVIEHVDDEGKVPMAYILSAQTALNGVPDPT